MIDMGSPQARVAQMFMDHKGLGQHRPVTVEKVEGESCWYFSYRLPDGDMELEVSWTEGVGWETLVTAFTLTD